LGTKKAKNIGFLASAPSGKFMAISKIKPGRSGSKKGRRYRENN
jgi:hypothetical protein